MLLVQVLRAERPVDRFATSRQHGHRLAMGGSSALEPRSMRY